MSTEIELLQEIANNTANTDSLWVAAIAAGAAILGAAVSAIFAYVSSAKTVDSQERLESIRIHTGIVTTERLRWLQDLRQRFAHLQKQMDMQYSFLKRPVPSGGLPDLQATLDSYSSEIMEEVNMITLMLNPERRDQADLRDCAHQQLDFLLQCFGSKGLGHSTFDDQKYKALKTRAYDYMASIGNQTWNQIKEKE